MGANKPVAPASLLQVGGAGRVVGKKSLELWERLWEPKIATLVNVHEHGRTLPLVALGDNRIGKRPGGRVRVTGGPFRGRLGLVAGMAPRDRVIILLSLLGGRQRVILPERDVVPDFGLFRRFEPKTTGKIRLSRVARLLQRMSLGATAAPRRKPTTDQRRSVPVSDVG